mmetsp:Transcript_43032/g.31419  ORF Transcript_43032/g.31419 Transcript_43032/m.31419 type:complete len:82 (+) Transcript_43032:1409-1654(+)|eukprot:CAMPEP_0202971608 /NCGR_PEP_ID=MMETSP1396-20130829/28637_1 /ASSEMBLY_ACC=CAM_ASM_000872 /TAXON_ID= /ORGANISM="Pseudokeronopsis sp., Strain Brazil" /LENGTH=81 /DNA_ID=CAMNT_0049701143 /DNA_START=1354 /DNA_END=1599 /DNA_ORIENTATION=-
MHTQFPQIAFPSQHSHANTPPSFSPNPYANEDFDKGSLKNAFGKALSDYSLDLGHMNLHPRPLFSRENSIPGSVVGDVDFI